jgi:branched-chain amino acid transport system ATP-binding protein
VSSAPLLEVADLHVDYGKSRVLHGVSLTVRAGEIVALLGRNGAGKTTTLRAVVGLVRPSRGTVRLRGEDLGTLPPFRRAARGLGYVPQERLLFDRLTVDENLRTGMTHRRDPHAVAMVYDLFPVLAERRRQRAGSLSGGEQQMVAIARALVSGPQLLLLDEPSTGLMPAAVERLAAVVQRLNQTGISVLLVEEKVPLALALASRVFVLDVGRIVHAGDRASLERDGVLVRHLALGHTPSASAEGDAAPVRLRDPR